MVQAIFFDIDGTLVSEKTKTYLESTKNALEKLRKKGILVFIATGRHVLEIEEEKLIEGLSFDGYVTLNGHYCYNEKEVIFEKHIDKEDIKSIVKQLETNPYPCLFVEKNKRYINFINQRVKDVQKAIYSSLPPVMDIKRALENPIYQVIPYVDEEKAKVYPLSVIKHSKATRWNPYAIDILSDSVSKREGIEKVLEYYNIPLKNTMAFGDGVNDIEMLEYVSIGVAMGNAREETKKVADYITDDVDNDGILKALEHFKLL